MGNGLLLLFIIGFLILSAFFSGSETAFFSLTKVQLKKLEKEKSAASKRVFRLLKRPRELLILILLGNTIVNVAASSAAALITINLFPESTELPLFVEIIVMTMILLIFGEITPKLVAYSSPQKFISFSSVILQILRYVLFPVIKILDFISSLFSTNKNISAKTNLSTEDIKHIINSSATEKSLEENEKQIIASIFRFSTTMAKEIMIPRVDIVAVEASDGLKNLKEIIFKSGHSRIPVYKKNIDNIIGIVYAKDIILNPEKKTISALLRPPLFITENVKIQNLLNQLKKKKLQIAIVVDEYGGTSGLITLEDILEELVGDILDEYDKENPRLSKISENEFLVSGMYSVAELNQKFSLNLDEEKYNNLAEFLYDNFNKVPKKNDSFIFDNKIKFVVTNIKGQRINYAKLKFLTNEES